MATSVVETPASSPPSPAPQDGDDAYMDAGAAPLMPVLQHLYDAAGALRIAVLGQMSGGDRLSVDAGGTNTVFAVRVSRVVGLLRGRLARRRSARPTPPRRRCST